MGKFDELLNLEDSAASETTTGGSKFSELLDIPESPIEEERTVGKFDELLVAQAEPEPTAQQPVTPTAEPIIEQPIDQGISPERRRELRASLLGKAHERRRAEISATDELAEKQRQERAVADIKLSNQLQRVEVAKDVETRRRHKGEEPFTTGKFGNRYYLEDFTDDIESVREGQRLTLGGFIKAAFDLKGGGKTSAKHLKFGKAKTLLQKQQKLDEDTFDQIALLRDTEDVDLSEAMRTAEYRKKLPFVGSLFTIAEVVDLKGSIDRLGLIQTKEQQEANTPQQKIIRQQDVQLVSNYLLQLQNNMDRTIGANVYDGATAMPAYMIEFIATGGLANIGSGATKAAAKKILGKWAKTQTAKIALKGLELTSNAFIRTIALPQRVVADAAQRTLPRNFQLTDEGIKKVNSGDTWNIALAKGFGSVFAENFGEVSGESLTRIGKGLAKGTFAKFPKASQVKATKFFNSVKAGWLKANPKSTTADFTKKLLKKGGWSNIIAEVGEERITAAMQAVFGIEDIGQEPIGSLKGMSRLEAFSKAFLPGTENILVELGVLSAIPGGRVAVNILGRNISRAKEKTDIREQVDQETAQQAGFEDISGDPQAVADLEQQRNQRAEELNAAQAIRAIKNERPLTVAEAEQLATLEVGRQLTDSETALNDDINEAVIDEIIAGETLGEQLESVTTEAFREIVPRGTLGEVTDGEQDEITQAGRETLGIEQPAEPVAEGEIEERAEIGPGEGTEIREFDPKSDVTLTQQAIDLGRELEGNTEAIAELRRREAETQEQFDALEEEADAEQDDAQGLELEDDLIALAAQQQFFSEAAQRAEGTLDDEGEFTTPTTPVEQPPTAEKLPATAAPARLEAAFEESATQTDAVVVRDQDGKEITRFPIIRSRGETVTQTRIRQERAAQTFIETAQGVTAAEAETITARKPGEKIVPKRAIERATGVTRRPATEAGRTRRAVQFERAAGKREAEIAEKKAKAQERRKAEEKSEKQKELTAEQRESARERAKESAEKQVAQEQIKFRDLTLAIKDRLKSTKEKQKAILDYANEHLDRDQRNKVVARNLNLIDLVNEATRQRQFDKIKEVVDTLRDEQEARKERSKLKKTVSKIKSFGLNKLSRNRKKAAQDLLDSFDVAKPRAKVELEKLVAELREDPDNNIPDYVLDAALVSEKKALTEMDKDDVRYLNAIFQTILFEQKTENKERIADAKAENQRRVEEIVTTLPQTAKNKFDASKEVLGDELTSAERGGGLRTRRRGALLKAQTLAYEMEGAKEGPLGDMLNDLFEGTRKEYGVEQTVVERIGKFVADNKLGKSILGWSRSFTNRRQRAIAKRFKKKDVGKVERESVKLGGKDVLITKADKIAIYMHTKNPDNLRHLTEGGFVFPFRINTTPIKPKPAELQSIIDSVEADKDLKAFADETADIYDNVLAGFLNETSEEINGFTIADVVNYFPIVTSSAHVFYDAFKGDVTLSDMRKFHKFFIEGIGSLKPRVTGARTPLILFDAMAALERSARQTAMYVGYAEPLRKAKALLKGKTKDAQGNVVTVKQSVIENYQREYWRALEGVVEDIEGSQARLDDIDKWAGLAFNNITKGILSLNIPVAGMQVVSYGAASPFIPGKYWRKGAVSRAATFETMSENSPVLWARGRGRMSIAMGDAIEAGRSRHMFLGKKGQLLSEKTMVAISAMDRQAVGRIWKAAQAWVDGWGQGERLQADFDLPISVRKWLNSKDMSRGEKTARVTEWIIRESQPSYELVDRPLLARSRSMWAKLIMRFTSQRGKNYSIKVKTPIRYRFSDKKLADKTKAIRTLTKMFFILPALITIIRLGARRLRGRPRKDEEESLESLTTEFFMELAGANISDMTGLLSIAGSKLISGFDLKEPVFEQVNRGLSGLLDLTNGAIEGIEEGRWNRKLTRGIEKEADVISKLSGTGVFNLYRDSKAVTEKFFEDDDAVRPETLRTMPDQMKRTPAKRKIKKRPQR